MQMLGTKENFNLGNIRKRLQLSQG